MLLEFSGISNFLFLGHSILKICNTLQINSFELLKYIEKIQEFKKKLD